MIHRLAALLCLAVGGIAGYSVYINLAEIFARWTPEIGGGITFLVVFLLVYFPLGRPLAELLSDKLAVMTHRGRHIRSGSGLDQIPDASLAPPCSLCGAPGGPICSACNQKMSRDRRSQL